VNSIDIGRAHFRFAYHVINGFRESLLLERNEVAAFRDYHRNFIAGE
jgi:hypothetical protein